MIAQIPPTTPIADRALELARSGECPSVNHIRQRLRREGYDRIANELSGPAVNRMLIDAIRAVPLSGATGP